jgi:acyl-CoA hydrolase
MVNDGFMRLHQAGILKRRVIDDLEAMRRINTGKASEEDRRKLEAEGHWLDGGFFLGSQELYDWLRDLPADEARGLGMNRFSQINELYGSNEALEQLQRRDARFFNTCMMMTALASAVSDALADGRVVSGVGGQYNFVAMAHALRNGRSILMLRSTRGEAGRTGSNVLWSYGHSTIPRHLRDIAITEYGIADLLGASDEDCAKAMLGITDVRFQDGLAKQARASMKLAADFRAPASWSDNTPFALHAALLPFRRSGLLPDYPLGCDFSAEEQRLVRALGWLRSATGTRAGKVATALVALAQGSTADQAAMHRMNLHSPRGFREWLDARLVAHALNRTVVPA